MSFASRLSARLGKRSLSALRPGFGMLRRDDLAGRAKAASRLRPAQAPSPGLEALEERCLLCAILATWAQLPNNSSWINAVAAADFNGDGHMDMVAANTEDASGGDGATVSVYLGDGIGGFAQTDYATGSFPVTLAVADLNVDGFLDLAVLNCGTDPDYIGSVSVLLGDGTGGFGPKMDLPTGPGPRSLAEGDFNGDGLIDLAVGHGDGYNDLTISLFLGTGQGGFGPGQDVATGLAPSRMIAADFNGDGHLDLAGTNDNSTVSVLLGNGNGGFARTDFAAGSDPWSLTAGDFNGDGNLDLVTASYLSSTVSVLLGDGMGGFGPHADFSVSSSRSITAADFNSDGKLDLAMAGSTTRVLLGDGNGGFGLKNSFATYSTAVAAADFDGDGVADLAVGGLDLGAGVLRNVFLEVRPAGNQAPTPSTGGSHSMIQGNSLTLNALGSSDPNNDPLTYTWDLNGDGVYGDATGACPTLSWDALQAWGYSVGTYTNIRVKVDDGFGHVVISSAASLTITSWSPTASAGGPYYIGQGQPLKLNASASTDPQHALLTYAWDLNGDGIFTDATGKTPTVSWAQLQSLGVSAPGLYSNVQVQVTNAHVTVLSAKTQFTVGPMLFTSWNDPDEGSDRTSVLAADFNGDGQLDLVNLFGNGLGLSLGNGSGGFGTQAFYGQGAWPDFATAADFNGDGHLDLATVSGDRNVVSILLGDGSGGLGLKTDFPTNPSAMYCVSVTAADFNGDGKVDLAVGQSFGSISVLFGDGSGSFGPAVNFSVVASPDSIVVADLNGDGMMDLATASHLYTSVSVLINNGSGGFTPKPALSIETYPTSMTAADLNGDGKADLALAGGNHNNVIVLLGNGSGGFGTASIFAVGTDPLSVAAADFNGDGKIDLVTANYGSNSASVLLGNGNGGFAAKNDYSTDLYPRFITTADFNGDGWPDLVTANGNTTNRLGGVSLLMNVLSPAPTASGGGPYTALQGHSVMLQASGSNPDGDALSYIWDINGDGVYGDASGQSPTVTWTQLQALGLSIGTYTNVRVKASDSVHQGVSAQTRLTISLPVLTASAGGPYWIGLGQGLTLNASASGDQQGSPLTYAWDVNGDGDFTDATGVIPTLSWGQLQALGLATTGIYSNVRVRVDDGCGDVVTSPAAKVTIAIAMMGDANADGRVSFADYLHVEQNFGKSGKTWADGDFTGDGMVKFADYLLLEQNFGKSIAPAPLLADVPVATSSSGVAEQMTLPSALGFAPDLLATDAMVGNPARTASPDVAEALPAQPLAPTGRNVSGQAGYVQLPVATPAYTAEHRMQLAPTRNALTLKKLDRSLLEDLLAGYRLV